VGPIPVDQADIEVAYLDLPEGENEAIADARKTYLITLAAAAGFIAAALVILLS
jgi:hypothetical protein